MHICRLTAVLFNQKLCAAAEFFQRYSTFSVNLCWNVWMLRPSFDVMRHWIIQSPQCIPRQHQRLAQRIELVPQQRTRAQQFGHFVDKKVPFLPSRRKFCSSIGAIPPIFVLLFCRFQVISFLGLCCPTHGRGIGSFSMAYSQRSSRSHRVV